MHPTRELRGTKSLKLKDKRIVLGITGSIAAVDTVKLARELIRHGAHVFPVMTPAAQRIIHPDAVEFATGNSPILELTGKVEHVALCGMVKDRADLYLIAPATANTVGKMATAVDDTTVTTFATTAFGTGIPILVVPAMHASMYRHPIVHQNIQRLKMLKIGFVDPVKEEGKAKMASLDDIVSRVIRQIGVNDLSKKRVLVIAGRTEERIDQVRAVTNLSSGETGLALAREAYYRGADVTLWMGKCDCELPRFINTTRFSTLADVVEMSKKIKANMVLVPAALPDFVPKAKEGKISSEKSRLVLHLMAAEKFLPKLREKTKGLLVGFKLEVGLTGKELKDSATQRLKEHELDLIVANTLSEVKKDKTRVVIIDKHGKASAVRGSKGFVAQRIFDRLVAL